MSDSTSVIFKGFFWGCLLAVHLAVAIFCLKVAYVTTPDLAGALEHAQNLALQISERNLEPVKASENYSLWQAGAWFCILGFAIAVSVVSVGWFSVGKKGLGGYSAALILSLPFLLVPLPGAYFLIEQIPPALHSFPRDWAGIWAAGQYPLVVIFALGLVLPAAGAYAGLTKYEPKNFRSVADELEELDENRGD